MTRLLVDGITVGYGHFVVVADACFRIGAGEVAVVEGANGSGKSTLLDALSGYHKAFAGRVLLDKKDITTKHAHRIARRGVGRSFQNPRLPVTIAASAYLRLLKRSRRPAAYEFIRRLEVLDELDTPLGELSHGVRRLFSLAFALAIGERLLLLDEPSAGIGEDRWGAIEELIREAAKDGAAVLVVEHRIGVLARNSQISVRPRRLRLVNSRLIEEF